MELTIALMILEAFTINASIIIPLLLWNRGQAKFDSQHTNCKIESIRQLAKAIHDEIKDSNKRLVEIEKRNK